VDTFTPRLWSGLLTPHPSPSFDANNCLCAYPLACAMQAKRCAVFAQHRALYTIGTGGLNELVRGILVGAKYK